MLLNGIRVTAALSAVGLTWSSPSKFCFLRCMLFGSSHSQGAGSPPGTILIERVDVASGTELRILPLGDSITVGIQSSDGNGYRVGLQKDLAGSKLLFVGDLQNGNYGK